jgi:hypothetical protein
LLWNEPVGWVERSETHHLQLRHARAVTNYRRNFICGGSFFFTANLAERRLRLLVGRNWSDPRSSLLQNCRGRRESNAVCS